MSQSELLRAAVELLDGAGIPYMVVGSYASTFHGEPRMTRDIDVVVDPTEETIKLLVELVDRDRFYMGDAQGAFLNRSMFNLIEPATGWKVDFVVRHDRPFSETEFERRFLTQVAGVEVFMATAEDTMLAKLEWGAASASDRQMDDVIAIAGNQEVDRDYLVRWATELGVLPALEAVFSQIAVLNCLDLEALVGTFEAARAQLEALGAAVSIQRSPNDGRPKHAIWISVTGSTVDGQLTVWDSGEGELEFGPSFEDVEQKHFDGLTHKDVDAVLMKLISAVA